MVSLSNVLRELTEARDELTAAQAHYAEAVGDVATAKANLEVRRAEMVCAGVEGKNAEQREASIRLELSEAYADLTGLELELGRLRCRLEVAQVRFTAIRYQIRALEALGGAA